MIRSKVAWIAVFALLAVVLVVAVACGDDATPTPAPATATPISPVETPPPPTPTPEPTPTPTTDAKPFEGETLVAAIVSGPYLDAIERYMKPKFEEATGAKLEIVPSYGGELAAT